MFTLAVADFELLVVSVAVTKNVPEVLPGVNKPEREIVPPAALQVNASLLALPY